MKNEFQFYHDVYLNFKEICEEWGIDFTSWLDNFKEDLPNAFDFFCNIYSYNKNVVDVYSLQLNSLDHIVTIGEYINSKIFFNTSLRYTVTTKCMQEKYCEFEMLRFTKNYVEIKRIDLILQIFMFLDNIIYENYDILDNSLIFEDNYLQIKINDDRSDSIQIFINIKDFMMIHFYITE